MYALRQIAEVENNIINIHLPENFPSKKVEVLILPLNIRKKRIKNGKLELPELININKINYASQIILEERE